MPGDPKACREHAKNCYRIAAEAHTPEGRRRFEDLAQLWLKLAADRLLEAWGAPLDPTAPLELQAIEPNPMAGSARRRRPRTLA